VRRAALVVAAVVLLAGCGGADEPPPSAPPTPSPAAEAAPAGPPPFAACDGLAKPPPRAPIASRAAAATGRELPAIQLDCFSGDGSVQIDLMRGPAVVNLWASWCPPCREELPVFQRLADRTADRLHVVGVDTRDDPATAARMAEGLGVTFPTLVDPGQQLLRTFGGAGLPMTLFVDGDGKVRYVYNHKALDGAALAALVDRHLGVAVDLG
jgi:thiol-disulfide isomerase/thioredoxin